MVMRLKYVGSETSPDAGILWGFDVRKGDVIAVGDDHPDRNRLMAHPWFAPVSGGEVPPKVMGAAAPVAVVARRLDDETIDVVGHARKSMAEFDALPPEAKEIAREHGMAAAKAFLRPPPVVPNAFVVDQPIKPVDPAPKPPVPVKPRRKRRTKEEMAAARAAEAQANGDQDSK